MSHAVEIAQSPVTRWVTFSLQDETYGVDVMRVREVLRGTEIAPVPGAHGHVLGIINLRGEVVTVIDTRKLFGLGSKEHDDASRVVLIESEQQVAGILVDGVAGVVEIEASDMERAPSGGNADSSKYIQGVYSREDRRLILVDFDKLLSEDQWSELTTS